MYVISTVGANVKHTIYFIACVARMEIERYVSYAS